MPLLVFLYRLSLLTLLLAGCGDSSPPVSATLTAPMPGHVAISAEVVSISKVPDPQAVTYPDCLVVGEYRVLEKLGDVRVPERILVALPAFLNRELQPAADLRPGQLCRLQLPGNFRDKGDLGMLQMADDIGRTDLPLYYTRMLEREPRPLSAFPSRPAGYFATANHVLKAPLAAVRYPWSEKAAEMRRVAMEADLKAIQTALDAHGGDWDAWDKALAPFHADLREKVEASPTGKELLKGPHYFRTLRNKDYKAVTDDASRGPLNMITTLHRQLRERGIDLIVVPFPAKEMVNAHHFSDLAPKDGIYSVWRLKFTHDLLKAGVEVIDLTAALQENKDRHPWIFYDAADLHPAAGAIQIAAEHIAARLARYELHKRPEWPGIKYKLVPTQVTAREDSQLGEVRPGAQYPAVQVIAEDGSMVEVVEHSRSPVLIIGDSFTVVPGPQVPSASIPAHLAHHLGEVPTQLVSLGGSEKAMRMLAREEGSYLAGRAAVVFIFSPSRLLGAGSYTGEVTWDLYDLPPVILE